MISVIFLNYNRNEDLKRSLGKIFLQTSVDYEVLVVDQNSTDGSREMIKSNFPEVRLFELEQNLGVAGGRNYGAEKATGEYLVFIDDDAEFIDTNSLYKIDLVFSCNRNVNVIAFNVNGHPERPEKHLFFSAAKDKFTNKYIGCGHAIRSEVFKQLGGYTQTLFFWGEEIEFAIKTFTISHNRILYKGDIILYHRVSQMSRLKWKEGRFFYKVRNRMALMRAMFPRGVSFGLIILYTFFYFIRARQLNAIGELKRGIFESKKMNINVNRLNILQTFNYFFPFLWSI